MAEDLMRQFEQILNPSNVATTPMAPTTAQTPQGLAGIFPQGGMTAPMPVAPTVQQPAVSGWQELLLRMQNDPALRQAALASAVQLSAGPQGQESTMGHLTRSYATGSGVFDQARSAAEKDALAKEARARALQTADLRDAQTKQEMEAGTVRQASDLARITEAQELTPLKRKQLEAEIAKLEREGKDAPRVRALQDKLQEANLRALAVQAREAGRERNPSKEARDVFMETFKMSPEGQAQAGETEEQRDARAAKAFLQKGSKSNVGALVNYRTQLANDLLLAGRGTEKAATTQAMIDSLDAQISQNLLGEGGVVAPAPAAVPTAAKSAEASGLVNGATGKSKSGRAMIVRNGQWEYQ